MALNISVSSRVQAGSSTNTGSMVFPQAENQHRVMLLSNGKVLALQGNNRDDILGSEIYDPTTGTWTATPLTRYRNAPTITMMPNGKVLVVGGEDTNPDYSSTEIFDPATGIWTNSGALNYGRFAHTATLLPNGKVLVAGGANSTPPYFVRIVELYNPSDGTWTTNGSLITNRFLSSATLLLNGKVLIAGGYEANGINTVSSAELYDPSSGTSVAIVLTNAAKLPTGAFQFAFTNTSGAAFTALATTNLALPSSNWTALGGVTETSPGQFQFTDPQATNSPQRFYRVRSP